MRLGQRRAHRYAWFGLALALPLIGLLAVLLRTGPDLAQPQRLAPSTTAP